MKNTQEIYKGDLKIGDINISCAVLPDGTRVISESGILKHLGATGGKSIKLRDRMAQNRGGPIPMFLASKALEPYIDQVFGGMDLSPVEYKSGSKTVVGYKAEILPKVCEVWLKARDEKALQESQEPKAKKAEILMRGLAYIGITALVDEATGYQNERENFELQKVLNAYISEEVAKWQLTFNHEFYKQMFRLWGIPYESHYIKKKPQFIGNLTNKYIYSHLPDGVLDTLKQRTPKTESGNYKHRLHQSLTPEIGREHLKKQITEVTTIMGISNSKEEFKRFFSRKYKLLPQMDLDIDTEEATEVSK